MDWLELRGAQLYEWENLPHVDNYAPIDPTSLTQEQKEFRDQIQKAIEEQDLEFLHDLYIEYKLWAHPYCCPSKEIYLHFREAFNHFII